MPTSSPEIPDGAFDDPFNEALEHVTNRAVFLAPELRRSLHLAVFDLVPHQRKELRERGGQIIYVGRDDYAFTVHLRNAPSCLCVVVLQPTILRFAQDARQIIGGVLQKEIVERPDLLETCSVTSSELGHLARREQKGSPTPHTTEGEIEADGYAAAWGFRDGLRKHLANEMLTTPDSALRQQLTARVEALQQLNTSEPC